MNMSLLSLKKSTRRRSRRQKKHHLYLFQWQQHELLSLGHLHEVLQDILVCRLE